MERRIAIWTQEHAGTRVDEVVPVTAGLGDTELWRVRRSSGSSDLLFRLFAPGAEASARRELLAMRAAQAGGVPVPAVLACDVLDDRPFLLMTWSDGILAREALEAAPAQAHAIGVLLGETLGRIHGVAPPDGLSPPDAWMSRGGPALAPLRAQLERVPSGGRLLHLDYHPLNVLMTLGRVESVIDWTNTLAGPPHMDLARSRAILRVVALRFPEHDGLIALMGACEAGLVEGHTHIAGADPHPALSAAWGMAMTVDDLAGHLGKPEGWMTPALLDALSRERDACIAAALTTER
jgi:aminoglycoside phosphotransferase (APT) family kinase protein